MPQHYLKRFTNSEERIFVYDELERKSLGWHRTEEVANERGYFDRILQGSENDSELKSIEEQVFSSIDSNFGKILARAEQIAREGNGSYAERISMATFMVLQSMRTKQFREELAQFYANTYEKTIQSALDLALELVTPEEAEKYRDLRVNVKPYDRTSKAALHADFLFSNKEFLTRVVEKISSDTWIIGHNQTKYPLITSDSPVIRENLLEHSNDEVLPHFSPQRYHAAVDIIFESPRPGFASRGLQITYPISSEFVLLIFDKDSLPELAEHNAGRLNLKEDHVLDINSSQMKERERFVFSSVDLAAVPAESIDSAGAKSFDGSVKAVRRK